MPDADHAPSPLRAAWHGLWRHALRRPKASPIVPPDLAEAAVALAHAQRAFVGIYPSANRVCFIAVPSTGAEVPAPAQHGLPFAPTAITVSTGFEIARPVDLVGFADDGTADSATLALLLQRAHAALEPGGWCCVDVVNDAAAQLVGADALWPTGTGAACSAAALRTRCQRVGFEVTHAFGLGYLARSIERGVIIPAELVRNAGVFVEPESCARLGYLCRKPLDTQA